MENGDGVRPRSGDEEEIDDEEYEEASPLDQNENGVVGPTDPEENGDGGLYDSEDNVEADPSEPEENDDAALLDADDNDEAGALDVDDDAPQSLWPEPDEMPCTSETDDVGRPTAPQEPIIVLDSSDDLYTDEGEDVEYGDAEDADDDDTSQEQQRDLTVTFRSEETNEEIATATLILKRHDSVDKFLPFVGAILRSIESEQLKLRLMEDISQILINAKTEEIQRHRRSRLQ